MALNATYGKMWLNSKSTSTGWYIKTCEYVISKNSDGTVNATARYFGINLEGSYNSTDLKVWNVNDFTPALYILGGIYSK